MQAAWFLVSMDRISDARRLLSRCLALQTAAATPVATGDQQHACCSSMQRDYLDCYLTLAQLGSDDSPSPGGAVANIAAASTLVATLDSVSTTARKYNESPASLNKVWEKRWRDMHDYLAELQTQNAAGAAAQDVQHARQAANRKTVDAFLTLDASEVSTGVITVLTAPDDVNPTSKVTNAVATSSHNATAKNMLQV